MQMNSKRAAASGMRCCYPLGGTMTRTSISRARRSECRGFAVSTPMKRLRHALRQRAPDVDRIAFIRYRAARCLVWARRTRKGFGARRQMISATRFLRPPLLETAQRHKNLVAGFLLLVFTLIAVWDLVSGGIVVGKDTITQYYPWYSYLGERLRSQTYRPGTRTSSPAPLRGRPSLRLDLSARDDPVHHPAGFAGRR